MRIAMIGQKGIPASYGGVERHVDELATRLAGCGFDVTAYCRPWYTAELKVKSEKLSSKGGSASGGKVYKGVKLVCLPSIKTKHLDAFSHTLICTLHAIIFGKYDIIHYHAVGPSLLSWLPRIFCPKTKVIVTFHCIDRKHQKWGFLARLALRTGEWAACNFAHRTIAVSKTLRQYCAETYDKETEYIPNGVNMISDVAGDKEGEILKQYDLQPEKYLLMVSRLVRHKGAHYLIQAFKTLKELEPKFKDIKLVIAGDSSFTDDYVKELKRMARDDEDVVFTGFQSGKPLDDLFANCLAVAHPSESEGLPIAVLEAMSYGKVVVASDIPENMELVENYGISFKNKNVPDLARQLKNLVNQDDLKGLGQKAKKFVAKEYSWDNVVLETKKVYSGI